MRGGTVRGGRMSSRVTDTAQRDPRGGLVIRGSLERSWELTFNTSPHHQSTSDARLCHRHGRLQVCAAGDAQAHGRGACDRACCNDAHTKPLDQTGWILPRRHTHPPTQDRNAYLDALNVLYRVGLDEGRERYGPRFCNNPFLTAAHNSHKVREGGCCEGVLRLGMRRATARGGAVGNRSASLTDSLKRAAARGRVQLRMGRPR